MGPICPSVCANFCSAVRQSRTISPSTITVDFLPYPALPYPTLPYPNLPSFTISSTYPNHVLYSHSCRRFDNIWIHSRKSSVRLSVCPSSWAVSSRTGQQGGVPSGQWKSSSLISRWRRELHLPNDWLPFLRSILISRVRLGYRENFLLSEQNPGPSVQRFDH